MDETTGFTVFFLVVAARFLLPFTIPRYPLPGVVACMILDAVDQTIFQQFPSISLEGYQSYDKALDIYYLTIAYVSTYRNWTHAYAFQVGRFLFYWRLLGVVLFELTNYRPLLLVFPNCFEYFFIFYEFSRLSWDPQRMTKRSVLTSTAFIWIVIKLPQEYWLHIARLDLTDSIKFLYGAAADTPWGEIFAASPAICLFSIFLLIFITAGVLWFGRSRLPPADHRLPFSTDAPHAVFSSEEVRKAIAAEAREIIDTALVEKIILVGMICVIFVQILPGVVATNLQTVVGVAIIVIINTTLSHWMARRRFGWVFSLRQGMVLLLVNSAIFLVYAPLMAAFAEPVRFVNVVFFVLLLTLLITLYDRYRLVSLMRFPHQTGDLIRSG